MLRSRMFTPGLKLFVGLFAFLMSAALVVGVATELQVEGMTAKQALDQKGAIATLLGPMTVGWKGAVGNHLAYSILLSGAVVMLCLAVLFAVYRDADPGALAEAVESESVPLTRAPAGASYMPITAAFSVIVMGIGWVRSTPALIAGFGLLVISAAAWTIRAWAERATGDSEVNAQIFKRIVDPFRVPVLAVAVIAFVVIGFSRVLLAVPDTKWSSIAFGGIGLLFAVGVVVVAAFPQMPRSLIASVLVVGALGVLGGLIWGGVAGERHIGHATESESDAPSSSHEGGAAPIGVVQISPTSLFSQNGVRS